MFSCACLLISQADGKVKRIFSSAFGCSASASLQFSNSSNDDMLSLKCIHDLIGMPSDKKGATNNVAPLKIELEIAIVSLLTISAAFP